MDHRNGEALELAKVMHGQEANWIDYFREILGVDGVVRKLFDTKELEVFRQSAEYQQIVDMMTDLRGKEGKPQEKEPTRVITLRVPQSVHEALIVEAHDAKTSLNKHCLSKLISS